MICHRVRTDSRVSKLGTVEEEADESAFWLEFIKDLSERLSLHLADKNVKELGRLGDEANQLVAITVASKKTARANF